MRIGEIRFDDRRLYLRVEIPEDEHYRTQDHPHLPGKLFEIIPSIRDHQCDNEECLSFEAEAQDTEIPHLFEHLVIELQVKALGGALSGETSWDWTRDPRGCFRVSVDYRNRELAMEAVKLATRIINAIDQRKVESIDLSREIAHMRTRVLEGEREAYPVPLGPLMEVEAG
ncbi:MAG: hypothetical protein C4521_01265 [Actinobacteria bacterium]|nr:MAG: hypothetical protein C4521_01265 [Actinomycetota bacterium]